MLNKHAFTNLALVLIAGVLLVVVAQGGLAQLSPQPTATSAEQPPAHTNSSATDEGEVDEVAPLLERLLVYVFLIWALALGVEAGVEVIRWVFKRRFAKGDAIANGLPDRQPCPAGNAVRTALGQSPLRMW